MQSHNIFFIDNNVKFLESAVNYLSTRSEVSSIGWGFSFEKSKINIEKFTPNLVFVDLSMPNINGIESTIELKKGANPPKVYVVSFSDEKEYINEALAAGADGYISKNDFVNGINAVLQN